MIPTNPDFLGLLVIPSWPMALLVFGSMLLIPGAAALVFMWHQDVSRREKQLPMISTNGIKSPDWTPVFESQQSFQCGMCHQLDTSPHKVYFSRLDPQVLLIVAVHRCAVQAQPITQPRQKINAIARHRRLGLSPRG